MSDVKRYWVFAYNDEPTEDFTTEMVMASDYATLREECRWAMQRYVEERNCYFDFVCSGGKGEIEERKANDPDYQRAQDWLAANREEKAS